MARLPITTREEAIRLRSNGYSLKEIAEELHIAKSTASLWLRDIALDERAQSRLAQKKLLKYYKQTLKWKNKKADEEALYRKGARKAINHIHLSTNLAKLLTASIFWCEGSKGDKGSVRFTNSDPVLVSTFLSLSEKGFGIKKRQWRARLHLHEYHSEEEQQRFWSKRTGIPLKRFYRSYRKPNTGKRERENYPGCIAVACYNSRFLRELKALWWVFSEQVGRVR